MIRHNNILKSILLILISLLFATSVLAHPGKTDGNGGHTNSNTGEYHYHHGYEAHFHIGGQCPFDFDNKTGQTSGNPSNSGSSGPSSNWETTSKDVRPDAEQSSKLPPKSNSSTSKNTAQKSQHDLDIVFTIIAVSALIIITIIESVVDFFHKNKKRNFTHQQRR